MGDRGETVDDRRARARAWLDLDPDPDTRAEIEALLAAGDDGGLAERFDGRLTFGTSGLRGALGAGPRRMNRVVVRQAAAGLASFLGPGATVVIGRDARHKSDLFAGDSARVLAAAGCRALVLPGAVPTPLLAFAVRHLGADAGLMCTASHNPPGDNGCKVYLGDGAQVIPPAEGILAAAIEQAAGAAVALSAPDDPAIVALGDEVAAAYLDHAVAVADGGARDLRIVYTALHGVGRALTTAAFARAGFPPLLVVESQADPDPDFPTVVYPNPEEPGALDRAEAEAVAVDADLVLAHDPDGDRLGVMVPRDGRWVPLSGNQIGWLLAEHLLSGGSGDDRLVVTTFASSRLLARLAADHGVHVAEVPTGFKWIVRPAIEHPEWRFVFGYEEALGYAVEATVRDKDGITSALVFARLVAGLTASGRSVWDVLADLDRRYGRHATETWAVRGDGPGGEARIAAAMAALRAEPPASLAGRAVEQMTDLAGGFAALAEAGPVDAVVLDLAGGARVVVRPSGTEPKLKCYLEVVVAVDDAPGAAERAEIEGAAALGALASALDAALGLGGVRGDRGPVG